MRAGEPDCGDCGPTRARLRTLGCGTLLRRDGRSRCRGVTASRRHGAWRPGPARPFTFCASLSTSLLAIRRAWSSEFLAEAHIVQSIDGGSARTQEALEGEVISGEASVAWN